MTPLRLATAASTFGALALLLACDEHRARSVATGPLPSGLAARVGDEDVRLSSVARIVQAQGVSPWEARDRAVSDALFAAAVRSDPQETARVTSAERSVLARAVVERLRDDAAALGPPTEDEVRQLTEQRWPELDRPPSVRTTHAVVLVKKPADDAAARELAAAVARAVAGATDSDDFIARAKQVPSHGLEVTAEALPAATADGRMWDPNERVPKAIPGSLDLDFARAAAALEARGDQSPLVKSSFGYHVIRLEERYPPVRTSLEERREKLSAEVLSRRAKRELDVLVARLRAQTPVETDRAVEALTALVPAVP